MSEMVEEVRELHRQWVEAERACDAAAMESLLGPDFLAVGPVGFLLTKDQWLDRFRSGDLRYAALTWEEPAVRAYGDAAILAGAIDHDATYRGTTAWGRFRLTHIAVRENGRRTLAGMHLRPVAPPAEP